MSNPKTLCEIINFPQFLKLAIPHSSWNVKYDIFPSKSSVRFSHAALTRYAEEIKCI